jgi:hypothetical protein
MDFEQRVIIGSRFRKGVDATIFTRDFEHSSGMKPIVSEASSVGVNTFGKGANSCMMNLDLDGR